MAERKWDRKAGKTVTGRGGATTGTDNQGGDRREKSHGSPGVPGESRRMGVRLFSRNFILLVLGQVSSLVGNYTLKFALSMYVLEQTGSAAVYAGLLAVAMLPTILLSPLGGILADRADRRAVMVALDAMSGLAVLAGGAALSAGGGVISIGVLLVVLSVLGAFESPTVQACVPQMLSGENILRGNAVVNQIQALAALLTPFLGSLCYTSFGLRPVFCATAGCFLITVGLECLIRLEYRRSERPVGVGALIRDDLRASARFLIREEPGVFRLLLLAALLSMLVVGIIVVGTPYLVRTTLGLSAGHYALAESGMGVASVVGGILVGLLAGRFRFHAMYRLIIAVGLCLIPAGLSFLLPLEVMTRYSLLVAMLCGCQLLCSVFSIFALSAIQERTPEHLAGKVMACVSTLSLCAQPLGQILYGVLFDGLTGMAYLVLIPSGLLIVVIGVISAPLFQQQAH